MSHQVCGTNELKALDLKTLKRFLFKSTPVFYHQKVAKICI